MGRCYEFGVLVGEGCEHAMVVPHAAGRCECATCAVVCTGRFAGCAGIIERPGYVPPTAPAWAVAVGRPPERPGAAAAAGGELGPAPAPRPVRQGAEGGERHGPAADVGSLEAVRKQLAEHDVELATRIDALAEQVAGLHRRLAGHDEALRAVVDQLAALGSKLGEGRPAGC